MRISKEGQVQHPPAARPADAEATGVDTKLWGSLSAELGPDFNELFRSFLAGVRHRIDEIEVALRGHDGAALELAGHSLKGASGSFGARALAALGERLEGLGRTGRFGEAEALLAPLASEFERLQVEVACWMQDGREPPVSRRDGGELAGATR